MKQKYELGAGWMGMQRNSVWLYCWSGTNIKCEMWLSTSSLGYIKILIGHKMKMEEN